MYLNAHGVTSAMRSIHTNGEYQGLPKPLGMADVEGGGKWGNRADDTLCVHRYSTHPTDWMYSNISILKVKENETGGRPTSFDAPIQIKMKINNVGFEYLGKDLLDQKEILTDKLPF